MQKGEYQCKNRNKYKIQNRILESDLQSTAVRDWNRMNFFYKLPITFENFPRVSEVFRAFPSISKHFRRFPKIFKNFEKCRKIVLRTFRLFPIFSEKFRRLPKISEDLKKIKTAGNLF